MNNDSMTVLFDMVNKNYERNQWFKMMEARRATQSCTPVTVKKVTRVKRDSSEERQVFWAGLVLITLFLSAGAVEGVVDAVFKILGIN